MLVREGYCDWQTVVLILYVLLWTSRLPVNFKQQPTFDKVDCCLPLLQTVANTVCNDGKPNCTIKFNPPAFRPVQSPGILKKEWPNAGLENKKWSRFNKTKWTLRTFQLVRKCRSDSEAYLIPHAAVILYCSCNRASKFVNDLQF